jgi:hypothetical protein
MLEAKLAEAGTLKKLLDGIHLFSLLNFIFAHSRVQQSKNW